MGVVSIVGVVTAVTSARIGAVVSVVELSVFVLITNVLIFNVTLETGFIVGEPLDESFFSQEMMLRLKRDMRINIKQDLLFEKDLLKDKKELAEHLMLLDLGRNDVGKISKINSVKVTENFKIEKYSHVMHIVSNVEGTFNKKNSKIDSLLSGFPAGTVSGAPKIRAMEIIDKLEITKRKIYAGGIGYFSSNGDFDTCIALRTALTKKNKFYIQAGAGIVADSVPEKEYQETVNKAKALINAAR